MVDRRQWRQRLLGTLQGQLEAATFAIVLVGFTVASTASLVVAQQIKIAEHHKRATRLVQALERCIERLPNRPLSLADSKLVEGCLARFSGLGHLLWVELANGALVSLPTAEHGILPKALPAAMQRNPNRQEMVNIEYKVEDKNYLSHMHMKYPAGHRIWIIEDVTDQATATNHYLLVTSLVWAGMLALILAAIFLVVRRLALPLRLLVSEVDLVTADSLASRSISIDRAPQEIQEIVNGYNRLLSRLSSSWEQQCQFANAVSHELRTPLTIVAGYLKRVVKRGDNLTPQQRKDLLTASEENERITRLIKDLLDLSRSDSGRLTFEQDLVRPCQLLEDLVENSNQGFVNLLRLSLPVSLEDRALCIRVNADRLRQVVLNLLENAQKYSAPDSPIDLMMQRRDDCIVIEVRDYGIGISADELPHIFDRFYRAANATAQQGSGLGLSVVKLLLEAMNGTIQVQSELGESTTFALSFPIA